MKITKTRESKTLYDTNGNKISFIRREITEIESQSIIPHNREESRIIKKSIETYKTNFKNAKKLKSSLEKAKGYKEGGRVFREMADLIMVINNPIKEKIIITNNLKKSDIANLIWDAAKKTNEDFQNPPSKRR